MARTLAAVFIILLAPCALRAQHRSIDLGIGVQAPQGVLGEQRRSGLAGRLAYTMADSLQQWRLRVDLGVARLREGGRVPATIAAAQLDLASLFADILIGKNLGRTSPYVLGGIGLQGTRVATFASRTSMALAARVGAGLRVDYKRVSPYVEGASIWALGSSGTASDVWLTNSRVFLAGVSIRQF